MFMKKLPPSRNLSQARYKELKFAFFHNNTDVAHFLYCKRMPKIDAFILFEVLVTAKKRPQTIECSQQVHT